MIEASDTGWMVVEFAEVAVEALWIAGANVDRIAEVVPIGHQDGADRVLAAVSVAGNRLRVVRCHCDPVATFMVLGSNRATLRSHAYTEAAQAWGDAIFAEIVAARRRRDDGLAGFGTSG